MRILVVLGMTFIVLVLSAIVLPPKGSSAMPRDEDRDIPAVAPR
jgi:hypothetical protein